MKQICIFDENISDMKFTWKGDEFSKQLKQKRLIDDNTDMRSLAIDLDISAATISRCENGRMPDLKSYSILCTYLGKPMNSFIKVK